MAKIDVDDIGYVDAKNVVDFFSFLIGSGLADEAVNHLRSLGVVDIAISQQAVASVKDYLKDRLSQSGNLTPAAQVVTECICCNGGCRNK